ncbi:hypothetical protein QBC33DRAFT_545865 [Phialemonium atrogriseum]|uniref:Secreted protein n=1 Tax=Phialemonium atrogriseum TaxID=1093897 RepID=A0AAJ0BWK8_9PEZI|nr:uncharacterized protein QBC33DRAFT_545865 [Phialemonium atrogriseum]KAK1764748.1 hypothetical protein QBC33DRAFT_545865 [Phialemonium atrogriseum]
MGIIIWLLQLPSSLTALQDKLSKVGGKQPRSCMQPLHPCCNMQCFAKGSIQGTAGNCQRAQMVEIESEWIDHVPLELKLWRVRI